jgi:anti-sigma B factor antagonist
MTDLLIPLPAPPEGDDHMVLSLAGELDISTLGDLYQPLRAAVRNPRYRTIVVNLRDVTFIDCCTLEALTAAGHQLRQEGRRLVLVSARPVVQRAIVMTKLEARLPICGTVQEALSA